ncbi:hypothetical protein SAMN02745751_03507 [Dethiosulfatibacter aminovorans DSM 17477]|uniref:GrdX protein n=1 Tax=Dethiosulfatibacter aminovorans DSM 17477 TaxID=1121476 RepID=A0A1M6MKU5_9FIRM|nr:GrdX family protein [Dethiosulfatibacter aminovorans]SHJ84101.1 hypothetical protein SAMN02745751_03507 [Dethiosulfatibacter aminovorans DSM 17477]
MEFTIVTNNSEVSKKYGDTYNVHYEQCSYEGILTVARDYVHKGYGLLTHPLSGSVKPNETPFKTIIVVKNNVDHSMDSLKIIESSIETASKFKYSKKTTDEEILDDFRCIDLSLVENVINRLA